MSPTDAALVTILPFVSLSPLIVLAVAVWCWLSIRTDRPVRVVQVRGWELIGLMLVYGVIGVAVTLFLTVRSMTMTSGAPLA